VDALDLHRVFDAKQLVDTSSTPHDRYRLRILRAGTIRTPSRALVASDPFSERKPFTQEVPDGEHLVELLIAAAGDGDERVAFARVVFRAGAPARWALGALPGDDVRTLGRGSVFGYRVDCGWGCFSDGRAFTAFAADADGQQRIEGEMERARRPTALRWQHAGADLVTFRSGWGDGSYATWFGLADEGMPVCAVTDFGFGSFARPVANPDAEAMERRVAELVDRLVAQLDSDAIIRELALTPVETTAHLPRLLAAFETVPDDETTGYAWCRLVADIALAERGQSALAQWLASAPTDAIARLFRHDPFTSHHDLGPELALALRGLHATCRVTPAVLLGACERFRGTARPLQEIIEAATSDPDPAVRKRADVLFRLAKRFW